MVSLWLYYAGAIRIVHMIFLSFGGLPIRVPIPAALAGEAIHQLGVLQKDPAARHILVHPDRPGMTWIDFERAVIFSPRVTLGSLSANRKRKLEFREGAKSPEKSENACAKQMARLVGSTSFRGRAGG
jgi:hypothetical protein